MNTVEGIYKDGKVILDQPVDWPDGVRVNVLCEADGNPKTMDTCVDGSSWGDSAEGRARWMRWFDSLGPVFIGDELKHFEADLARLREEQRSLSSDCQQRIENLVK